MDPDTLRIILIVAGSLLLLGLYLWERRRARTDEDESYDSYEEDDLDEDKLEPRLGAWNAEEGNRRGGAAGGGVGGRTELPEQPELQLEPPEGPDELGPVRPASPLILSLHLTPVEGIFDGEAIVHAAGQCGVEPGEMDIFHRYADPGTPRNPLFSLANMLKPGTFPFGAMADFETPGLTLFSQSEGASNDPARLEEMLSTAHCLADKLNAEIRDETRALLTPEVEERLRDRVLELVTWRLSDTAPE
ncbi:MAG: cell division protein ZipA C-terminal FtsZ-binding domain-containing protein [Chromatiaceae bacterium]|jgi:cell division protein ZipA|nr:cell division protein ZipA C-terminal FtsZ-binding domain-containing protein [Chromatiaceae bacterium]